MGMALLLVIAVFILFLLRHRLMAMRFDWRTWVGFSIGAGIGIWFGSAIQRLGPVGPSTVVPMPILRIAFTVIGGLALAAPVRRSLEEAIPRSKEEHRDDAPRKR